MSGFAHNFQNTWHGFITRCSQIHMTIVDNCDIIISLQTFGNFSFHREKLLIVDHAANAVGIFTIGFITKPHFEGVISGPRYMKSGGEHIKRAQRVVFNLVEKVKLRHNLRSKILDPNM